MGSLQAFLFLAVALAGWVNQHQQAIIDYLVEENRILKRQLQGRRLQLSDNDRRRLAAKAKMLERHVLDEVANLVIPDTLLARYRNLIALKWTYARKGPRPAVRLPGNHRVGSVHSSRKSRVGLRPIAGRAVQSRPHRVGRHSSKHSEASRDRAGAGARQTNVLGYFSESPLGGDGRHRFLHHCGIGRRLPQSVRLTVVA